MRRNKSIRTQVFVLILAIICVLVSAGPLFNRHNDAQILMLFFGAFGAGVTVSNLIHKRRKNNDRDDCQL